MTARFHRIAGRFALLGSLGSTLVAPYATAQDPGADPGGTMPPVDTPRVSEEKSETFTAVSREVMAINERWNAKMQGAFSYQEREEMQERAREDMAAAVERSELSVEEYNRLANTLRPDTAPPLPVEPSD
jgi:hypothetical protein